ncbi:MAG: hypothetical protein JWR47_1871 [Phenylobacterium sp.]|nr:hypothetical protein [Phenylobacterium sp.]
MSEMLEPERSSEGALSSETGSVGVAVALDEARHDPSLRGEVAAFLAAQRKLAELQARQLNGQVRDLKVRSLSDLVKLALQGLTLAAALALIVVLVAMVNDAANARGLVVAGFSAPPSFAARGMSGEVLAGELISRIDAVHRFANANSLTRSDDVRGDNADAVKLEIPQTGLSLDDLARFLRRRLGHEVRLTGDVRDEGAGIAAITLAVSGSDPIVVRGTAADMDGLLQQAAEKAFQAFDPSNFILYLVGRGRSDDAREAADHLAHFGRTPDEQTAGYALSANTDGDRRRASSTILIAIQAAPTNMASRMEAASSNQALGHDEAMLAFARQLLKLRPEDQPRQQQGSGVAFLRATAKARIDQATGDFGNLESDQAPLVGDLSDRFVRAARAAALLHDGGTAAGRLARLETLGDGQTLPVLEARWRLAAAVGDWPSARATAEALMKAADLARAASQASAAGFIQAKRETVYEPWLALSQARTGQVTQAQAVVGQTPLDCYLCVRARAQVAAAAGDRAGADRWFAEAVRQGPSLPYAHLEWGQAKLARGDVRGALAELAKARSLGPRFADASEAWGEALLASGDAAAAEQKFQAAAALAPRWGRLHLKWGEALARQGRAEDAHSQFKAASALSLSAPDRAELAAQHV